MYIHPIYIQLARIEREHKIREEIQKSNKWSKENVSDNDDGDENDNKVKKIEQVSGKNDKIVTNKTISKALKLNANINETQN